jgi:hypothetical protein
MKTMMLAAAAMTLAVAVNPGSALAEAPKAGGSGYAMYQTAEMQPSDRAMSPRYQWQYHYGRKTQFEGHWVVAR